MSADRLRPPAVITPVAGRDIPAEAWHAYKAGVQDAQRALQRLADDDLDATAVVLKGSQMETLRQALTDAVAHRDPGGLCEDCEIHPAGLCIDHADDLDRSDAYLALAAELELEVER